MHFIYWIGVVLYMCLYQCWSSLDLKLFTDGDDITLSGNEFQFLITLLLKQCCRIVLLHLRFSNFILWPLVRVDGSRLSHSFFTSYTLCRPVARISKGGVHFWPDPKLSSWGSGGRRKPPSGVRAESRRQTHFGKKSLNWLKSACKDVNPLI